MAAPTVQHVPISSIKPNPSNPRTIRDERFHKLVQSIKDFPEMLELRPIVTDAERVVLGGNMRLKACKAAGLKTVPVVVADHLTEAQRREFIVKDNVGFGDWDCDALANEWDAGELAAWGLEVPDSAQEAAAGLTDPDAVPEVSDEPITKPGDLWLLGRHRLLCGDSTSAKNAAKLLNGQTPDILLTDPPYGMRLNTDYSSMPRGGKTYAPVIGDDQDFDFAPIGQLFPTKQMAVWGGGWFYNTLPKGGSWIVWDKQPAHTVSGRQNHFEECFIWPHKKRILIRKLWTGFTAKEKGEARVHPTQKPVEVIVALAEFMGDWGLCVDPFLGSGTTIIACEQLNRRCYGMEIDAKYCDVIVRRWEEFTGQKAIRQTSTNREDTGNANAAAAVA
jgi:DNA modification methylase